MGTPWEARLGVSQGRIQPHGATPSDGSWLFVLGDDQEGRTADLDVDDFVAVSQDVDLTGIDVVNLGQAEFRFTDPSPAGGTWELELLVGGSTIESIPLIGDLSLTGVGIDVHAFSGVQTVMVRLALR